MRVNKLNIKVKQKGRHSIDVIAAEASCQVLNLSPPGLEEALESLGHASCPGRLVFDSLSVSTSRSIPLRNAPEGV